MTGSKENASPSEKHVTTDPQTLFARPPFDQPQLISLQITNIASKLCVFKVLASHPKLYKIKNRVGVLKPSEVATTVVKLEACSPEALNGHKIVVQTTLVEQEPANKDEFWKSMDGEKDSVQFTKVKILVKDEPLEKDEGKNDEDEKPKVEEEKPRVEEEKPRVEESKLTKVEEEKPKVEESKMAKTDKSSSAPMVPVLPLPDPPRIVTLPAKEIVFNGPFTLVDSTAFTIFNLSRQFLYFRFVFGSDLFKSRPQYAIIDPGKNKIFAIIIKKLNAEDERKAAKKKHKFQLEYFGNDNNKDNAMSIWSREGLKPHCLKMTISIKPAGG